MMTSDKLQILYFYIENDSAGKARYSVVDQFSQSVYGYMDIWTVNCEWWNEIEEIEDKITLKICARAKEMRTQLPRLLAMVPPVPRVDPRTGQVQVPTDVLYDDFSNFAAGPVTKWALNLLPTYRMRIKNIKDTEYFMNRREDLPYKVVLFSNKKKTWGVFKAITAEFFNRADFAEVYKSATKVTEFFNIDTYPKLVAYKYNGEGKEESNTIDDYEVNLYHGRNAYSAIKRWLDTMALKEKSVPEGADPTFVPEEMVEEEPLFYDLTRQNADDLVFSESRVVVV